MQPYWATPIGQRCAAFFALLTALGHSRSKVTLGKSDPRWSHLPEATGSTNSVASLLGEQLFDFGFDCLSVGFAGTDANQLNLAFFVQ